MATNEYTPSAEEIELAEITFDAVGIDLATFPGIEDERGNLIAYRIAGAILRYDDKELTERVEQEDLEVGMQMLDSLASLKDAYKTRLEVVEAAAVRLLVAVTRAAIQGR